MNLVWSGLVWSGLVWSGLVWSGLVLFQGHHHWPSPLAITPGDHPWRSATPGDQPPLAITPGHHHWLSPLPITSANHPWPSSMAITSGHHHWHSPLLGALAVTPLLGRQVMARPSAVRSWATDIIPVQCNTTVHCAQYTCALVHNLLHSTLPVLHHTYTPVTVGQTPLHLQLQ